MKRDKLFDQSTIDRMNMLVNKSGMNATQLSNVICCNRKTVYLWLDGVGAMNMFQFKAFCQHFRVSADELLGLKEDK